MVKLKLHFSISEAGPQWHRYHRITHYEPDSRDNQQLVGKGIIVKLFNRLFELSLFYVNR